MFAPRFQLTTAQHVHKVDQVGLYSPPVSAHPVTVKAGRLSPILPRPSACDTDQATPPACRKLVVPISVVTFR